MIRENASAASTINSLLEAVDRNSTAGIAGIDYDGSRRSEENVRKWRRKQPAVERSAESGLSETTCRICYDTANPQCPVIYPCRCKGTMGAIHLACLERWLEESNRNGCELCGESLEVERTPRYRVLESIAVWMCPSEELGREPFVRSFRLDFIRCAILAPVTFACTYVCVIAADFYSNNSYDNFPPARWTTYSLLAMTSLLLVSCFVWIYSAIRYNRRLWYYWWQKTSTVRVKLPAELAPRNLDIEKSHV